MTEMCPGSSGAPTSASRTIVGMMKICANETTALPCWTEKRRAIHGDAERAQEPGGTRGGRRAPARPGGRADAAARAAQVDRAAEPGDPGRGRMAAAGGRGPDQVGPDVPGAVGGAALRWRCGP